MIVIILALAFYLLQTEPADDIKQVEENKTEELQIISEKNITTINLIEDLSNETTSPILDTITIEGREYYLGCEIDSDCKAIAITYQDVPGGVCVNIIEEGNPAPPLKCMCNADRICEPTF